MFRLRLTALAVAFAATVAPTARAADVDPLLPEKTEAVVHFNIKQMMESDIIKKFALQPLGEQLKKDEIAAIFETLGIDPLKDVHTMTQGIWEGDREKQEPPRSITILRGTFDPKKLGKAAETFANKYPTFLSLVEEAELKLVRLGPPDGGDAQPRRGQQASYLFVADEKTVIIGTSAQVVADADKALTSKAKAKVSKELAALLLRADGKASMYACAYVGEKLAPVIKLIPNLPEVTGVDTDQLKEYLAKARGLTAHLRVGKDVTAEIALGIADADAAQGLGVSVGKLVDVLKNVVLPFGKGLQPKATTLFNDIEKSIKHEVKKTDVTISLKLSPEAFAQLILGDE